MEIPKRGRGNPSKNKPKYDHDMIKFAEALIEEQDNIDFKIGTRGWCYHLEGQQLITKGEFDSAVVAITKLRKSGLLPVDFSADDIKRKAVNVIDKDGNIKGTMRDWKRGMMNSISGYVPTLLSDQTGVHFEVMVEKTDLVGLFKPICEAYQIPLTNIGGQADINSRVKAIRRCEEARQHGKMATILYCGDHDPSGLQISNNLQKNLKSLEIGVGFDTSFIEIERFGLTYKYIMDNDLVWVENLDTASSKKTKIGLGDPDHPDHNKHYVQDYIKAFKVRKVEANALLKNIPMARKLLEDTINNYIGVNALESYNDSLIESRDELKMAFEKLWGAA